MKFLGWVLSPENWPKIVAAVKAAAGLYARAKSMIRRKKVEDAEAKLQSTDGIDDDHERLKAKAGAQCEYEKASGSSGCDKSHPGRVRN